MATNSSSNIVTAAAGKVLQGAGLGVQNAFSTATYPSTATGTGKILRADGTNWSATTATYPDTAGTSGKILISDGTNIVSSTPTYPNAASTALKHIKSDGTNFVTTTVTYPDASVTAGKVIVSDGTNYIASTPTFPNASASSGKFIRSDGTNWVASTPTLPTTAGTAGKILYSDATNYVESVPTFPTTASATSRKMIVSDGTNWVASTETWATPSTSGNILTSDGTNWTSAAPAGGGITTITGTLTNAQIKALHGTPIQVIAAPGSGKFIQIITASGKMIYGGTNVFTAGSAQTINLYFGTASDIGKILQNSNITASATQAYLVPFLSTVQGAVTLVDNTAINLYNASATEITGNAANNNTISYSITYQVITI